MKQRSNSRAPSAPIQGDGPDPFRFGWRYERAPGGNGAQDYVRIPLTPDDVLHPQEGDQIPENTTQQRDRDYLFDVLELRLASRAGWLVLSDCLIDWGMPRLKNHSPDVSVFEDVRDTQREWTTFHVAEEGARPVLVIEIVSVHDDDPRIRDNDVKIKVKEYWRAGVPLYVIVDRQQENGPRRFLGFRRSKARFVPLALDANQRLLLEPVGLLLGLRDNRVVCYDATTGEAIPNLTGMAQARQQAEQARQQAEQARQQAEQARQQADAALAAAQARIAELEAQVSRQQQRSPRRRTP
jgi:Uma2 family endonuclease